MARADEFEGYTSKDLRELSVRIDHFIAEKQKAERSDLKAKFAAMAASSGLSIEDILGGSKRKGSSVAAKFRNPDDPTQTWSGRGRMPVWLNEKLKKRGTTKEDFAI